VDPRFERFPADLARRARPRRLGRSGIPGLLAHPDWTTPAPVMVWLHGRTARKELDPGRYLRWVRAGIAACAIDLPGHGERAEAGMDRPEQTPAVLARVLSEIDEVIDALADPELGGLFDLDRVGIGGMSAGGMAALRRLCDEHTFACAAVEATTGDLAALYTGGPGAPWPVRHEARAVAAVDPAQHLDGWRPIPLLALHCEADRVVPARTMREFLDRLRAHYRARGASEDLIELVTWERTGAPQEHAGFGRHAAEAKDAQVGFLRRHLLDGGG